jgi:RNA polymerase sigma-70 factor (ECF subfamily)
MSAPTSQSAVIDGLVQRLHQGDESARQELLNCACERLTRLTRHMLRGYPKVRRWEETDDVVQNALMRLYRTLAEVKPKSATDFYRLAALNIRRELLDLAKHYYGPRGLGANVASKGPGDETKSDRDPSDHHGDTPSRLAAWTDFHAEVEKLPDEERAVFDLLWYQELPQAEAALLLGVSERTIKRRWAAARLRLYEALHGNLPEL